MKRKILKKRRVSFAKFLKVETRRILIGAQEFMRVIVRKKNAAAFLVHDLTRDEVVFALQEREPMRTLQNRKGSILEAPAGHLESPDIPAEISREASEEVGATVRAEQVLVLNGGQMLAVSPGWTTECKALGYIPLEPGQLEAANRTFGLACEGEYITRKRVSVEKLETMQFQDLTTFALVQWLLHRRAKKRIKEAEKRIHELEQDLDAMRRMDDRS